MMKKIVRENIFACVSLQRGFSGFSVSNLHFHTVYFSVFPTIFLLLDFSVCSFSFQPALLLLYTTLALHVLILSFFISHLFLFSFWFMRNLIWGVFIYHFHKIQKKTLWIHRIKIHIRKCKQAWNRKKKMRGKSKYLPGITQNIYS